MEEPDSSATPYVPPTTGSDIYLTTTSDGSTRLSLPASDAISNTGTPLLKNPKACLAELPAELLAAIVKYTSPHYNNDFNLHTLVCLTRTSKGLKYVADELLYEKIVDWSRYNPAAILITLGANNKLAMLVKELDWCLDKRPETVEHVPEALLRIAPNLRRVHFLSYGSQTSPGWLADILHNAPRTIVNGQAWEFAYVKYLTTDIPIELGTVQRLLRLPSLEALCFTLSNTDNQPWNFPEPKSKVRNLDLSFDGVIDSSLLAQIPLSVRTLERFQFSCISTDPENHVALVTSWLPINRALAAHKDTLEELWIECSCCPWLGTLLSLHDFKKLHTLRVRLSDILSLPSWDLSLVDKVPYGLKSLHVEIMPVDTQFPRQCFWALASICELKFLREVEIILYSEPTPPFKDLRLSVVMQAFEKANLELFMLANVNASDYISLDKLLRVEEGLDAGSSLVEDSDDSDY